MFSVMKILFVESYPHVIFGQQRTMFSLLEESTRRGIECVIACTSEGVFVDEAERLGYRVELLSYPESLASYGGAIYRYRGIDKLRCYGQGLGYLRELRKKIKQLNVDVVFCNDMRGLLTVGVAARSLRVPVMIWDKLDKPHGWLDVIQLPLASCNPVITSAVLVKYPKWQQSWFAKKIHRVPNGADLERCDRGKSIRDLLPVSDGDVLVGIAGTITERKGHDRLLGALSEILKSASQVRVLVMGEVSGSEEDDGFLESLPHREHERVHFLGMRKDMPDIMKSLDVLVIPSRHEGMGQVTVEAMGASKPVIGSRAGGIPEVIVDGETGILIDGDSQQQMVDAVVQLANDAELREKMGKAGRKRAEEHFNRPVQMGKIIDLLEGLVKK